ncbi:MAG: hypothetical protein WC071_00335 [Victivallaceae bacterium]
MNKTQPDFNLFGSEKPVADKKNTSKKSAHTAKDDKQTEIAVTAKQDSSASELSPIQMRQAALAWLAMLAPSGVGIKVPTRIKKYQVDLAAFWSVANGGKIRPEKTTLIEIRHNRDHCWPDCGDHEGLLERVRKLKADKLALEAKIRLAEPELKDCDNLFEEYQSWKYSQSKNTEYHKCLKQIDALQRSLYKGSRLEHIRQAHAADFLYLAVPEGEVHRDELADGWGLLYVKKNQKIIVAKMAERQVCTEDNRLHLIHNIAISSRESVMFANGIRMDKNGNPALTKRPRRRHL